MDLMCLFSKLLRNKFDTKSMNEWKKCGFFVFMIWCEFISWLCNCCLFCSFEADWINIYRMVQHELYEDFSLPGLKERRVLFFLKRAGGKYLLVYWVITIN